MITSTKINPTGETGERLCHHSTDSNVISPNQALCSGLRYRCFLGCLSRRFVSSRFPLIFITVFRRDETLRGCLMEKVRVGEQSEVSKDVDGDYSQSCSETRPNTPGCFFLPCESLGNRASSFPAVVMGRGSKQAVSQQKGIELWATINTL